MRSLFVSELRRFAWRRLARIALLLVVLGIAASGTARFATSKSEQDVPPEARARAAQQVEACRAAQDRAAQSGGPRYACPTEEQVVRFFDFRFRFARLMPDWNRGFAILLASIAFVVGASYVGAEWSAGYMGTLLTWEPRRSWIFVAKVTAASSMAAAATLALMATFTAAHLPAGVGRGTMEGVDAGFWRDLAGVWMGGALLSALSAAVGATLAFALRHTAAAMGVAFGYVSVLDPLLNAWRGGRYSPWLLQGNVPLLLGTTVYRPSPSCPGGPGVACAQQPVSGAVRPAVLLIGYAVGLSVAGFVWFRSRDVP